jgi:hypothetical protein
MRSSGIYVPTVYQSDRYEVGSVVRVLVAAQARNSGSRWSRTAHPRELQEEVRRSDRAGSATRFASTLGCK